MVETTKNAATVNESAQHRGEDNELDEVRRERDAARAANTSLERALDAEARERDRLEHELAQLRAARANIHTLTSDERNELAAALERHERYASDYEDEPRRAMVERLLSLVERGLLTVEHTGACDCAAVARMQDVTPSECVCGECWGCIERAAGEVG